LDIATGRPEGHPSLLPYDAGLSPAVAPPPLTAGQLSGPTVPGASFPYADQVAADEAACQQAQAVGQDARNAMLGHYGQGGGAFADAVVLPPVPANAVPSELSDLYPYAGMEPTPAGTGFAHPDPLPE
jgi:hypothetical protein